MNEESSTANNCQVYIILPKAVSALQDVIDRAESQLEVRFLARYSRGTIRFHFSNGIEVSAKSLWDEGRSSEIPIEERLALLNAIPKDHWGEIYILGRIAKRKAVQAGLSVADTMAELMRMLLPLYEGAVSIG